MDNSPLFGIDSVNSRLGTAPWSDGLDLRQTLGRRSGSHVTCSSTFVVVAVMVSRISAEMPRTNQTSTKFIPAYDVRNYVGRLYLGGCNNESVGSSQKLHSGRHLLMAFTYVKTMAKVSSDTRCWRGRKRCVSKTLLIWCSDPVFSICIRVALKNCCLRSWGAYEWQLRGWVPDYSRNMSWDVRICDVYVWC